VGWRGRVEGGGWRVEGGVGGEYLMEEGGGRGMRRGRGVRRMGGEGGRRGGGGWVS
jgi:hypothetical protein